MNQDSLFLLLTLVFLILPLIWVLTDARTLQERFEDYLKFKSGLYFLAQLLVIFITYLSLRYSPWLNTYLDNLIIILGIILYLVGVSLAVWAKITMKSKWGLPAEHNIKRQNKIVKAGPFKFSRNPIYVGLILVVLGYSLALRSLTIILVPFIALYFYQVILKEEKLLTKHFGKEYLEYKSKVKRFI